jgi:hypothetical protein
MSDAERQARFRDRKNAALAALPGDPLMDGISTFDDYFADLPIMKDVAAVRVDEPRTFAVSVEDSALQARLDLTTRSAFEPKADIDSPLSRF